jgi:hypothetical protein
MQTVIQYGPGTGHSVARILPVLAAYHQPPVESDSSNPRNFDCSKAVSYFLIDS